MVRKVAKHVARNKKKYWKKISTKELEDHQDDVRMQEMTGGRREDQPDEILYQIDSEHPLGVESATMEISRPILRSVSKQRRAPLDLNNLNTYKLLTPHSSVPSPGLDSLKPKDPSSISTKRLVEKEKLVLKRKIATKKFQIATKQRSEALQKNAIAKADTLALDDPHTSQGYDLWNARDENNEKTRALVGDELASFTQQVTKVYDWKVPIHIINKPSKLSAVETPLPGTSYNPSYDDHQDLLQKAVEVEMDKEQKELKLLKQLPKSLSQNESASTRKSWLNEMASGLFDENGIEESGPLSSNSVSVGKPVKVQTKTVQQRNKQKERKKKEALAKQAKEKRIRDTTLLKVKSIRKELDKEARKDIERQVERKLEYEHREKFGTKKFGRYRFEEADLDLNLSDEITGNLRTMKAEGNLLHDRFKSLQKRNVIETRIRAKPTKTKTKRYEKRSVREVGENYRPK